MGVALALSLVAGCSNNPYAPGETAKSVSYRALGDDPKTFDPSVAYFTDESSVISNIYPGYYQYHPFKRNPFLLQLSLGDAEAKREPFPVTVTADGKAVKKTGERWTFTIKKGLRFQDDPCFPGGKGREITAADFLFAFKRMADPALASPIVSNFDDKILGLADFEKHQQEREDKKQKPDWDFPVEGLQQEPNDPYTFHLVLNQSYPQLKYFMAMTFTTPIAREAAEKYGEKMNRHPVGCGPFMMTEFVSKQRIILEKNPNYRPDFYPSDGEPGDKEAGLLEDAGKRIPFLDKIVFNIQKEAITAWNAFQQGYLDSAAINVNNYNQVMASANQLSPDMIRKGIKLVSEPGVNTYFFKFNMDDPVVGGLDPKHKKLRQALATALDWQQYIDIQRQGVGKLAYFILPPGVFGYDPDYRSPYRTFSLEKAKSLLGEAGYPNGIDPATGQKFTLFFDNTGTEAAGRQFNAFIIKQWEALGIHVESRPNQPAVWQENTKKGQFQIIYSGWYADYPDPENFAFLLYGPNKRPGPNDSNYHNPEYDKLFEQMRVMNDGPQRMAIINKMRAIVTEDCPHIYCYNDTALGINHQWVHNVKPNPVSYDSPKYTRIDGPLRARLQAEWNRPNYWPAAVILGALVLGTIPAVQVVNRRRNRYVRRSVASASASIGTTDALGGRS